MRFLISMVVIALVVDCGRSAPLPESSEAKSPGSQSNVILLEVPMPQDDDAKKVTVGSERVLLEGRNFSSLKDMINIVDEQNQKTTSTPEATPESYTIIVPVAREFSSLKELFEILGEDDKKTSPIEAVTDQAYVKGTELNLSDYTLFFTS